MIPILELKNVSKLYKNGRGVKNISFTLNPGEVLGLQGPNGAGKTTIMKAIAGLIHITSGNIHICGVDATERHEEAVSNIGCLIETPALYGNMTVMRNMQMAALFYKHVDDERISQVLRMVGMDKYKKDKIKSLSLGMCQRVGIGLAVLSEPKLLILDEPANGLDIDGIICVRQIIRRTAESGAAVIVSSHMPGEIQNFATKVEEINDGTLRSLSQ